MSPIADASIAKTVQRTQKKGNFATAENRDQLEKTLGNGLR